MNRKRAAFVMVVFANVIFGMTFMATSIASRACGNAVFGLLSARFLFASLLLLVLCTLSGKHPKYKGKHLGRLLGMALLYPSLYFTMEALSLTQVDSAVVGVVMGMAPISTALLMMLFFKEKQSGVQMCFIVLGIVGVLLINKNAVSSGVFSIKAAVFLFLALLSSSGYSVCVSAVKKEFTPTEITLFMFLTGSFVFTAMDMCDRGPAALVADLAKPTFLWSVLFLGLLASGLCGFVLNYALCILSPVTVSVFNNVSSVVAIVCGVLFMRESITWVVAMGCGCILAGCVGYSLTGRLSPEFRHVSFLFSRQRNMPDENKNERGLL